MTYGEIRTAVLQLLNRYTVAGAAVAESYNNQADALIRIPGLVNDALMELATTARKIPVVLRLGELEGQEEGELMRYTLPEDFFQFKSGGTVVTKEGKILHTNVYQTRGKKELLVPGKEAGNYTVEYYRYPRLVGPNTGEDEVMDNDPVTHRAIPYYVAAYLVQQDDAFLYQSFYNKYEDILARCYPAPYAEVAPVYDVYCL